MIRTSKVTFKYYLTIRVLLVTLLFVPIIAPADPQSQKIDIDSGASLSIKATHSDSYSRLSIELSAKKLPALKTFTLAAPGRFVIDLSHPVSRMFKSIKLAYNPFVKSVRVAAHENGIRIVLDGLSENFPDYVLTQSDNRLEIKFGHVAQPQATATSLPAPSPTAIATATPAATAAAAQQAPEIVSVERIAPSLAPSLPPTPVIGQEEAVATSPATTAGNTLSAIEFLLPTGNADPFIRLTFSHSPRYRLNRKDERLFELKISDVALAGQHLSLPLFPPQEFKGLTHVSAQASAQDIALAIGTEAGARVEVAPNGSELRIKVKTPH